MIVKGRPGRVGVFGWELRKLAAQPRTYLGLAAAVIVPVIFVGAVALGGGGTPGLPFGAALRTSGLAVPLVSLSFGAFWLIPLITALVAGDIVAAEYQGGTLKTILTRSASRRVVWTAKAAAAFAYATAALALFLTVGLVAGVLVWGWHPLPTPGGPVGPWKGLALLAGAAGAYLLPTLALAAIGLLLSTVTRNSGAAIVGTLLTSILSQLVDVLDIAGGAQQYLLSAQFTAWTGVFEDPVDWAVLTRAVVTCCSVIVVALLAGARTFLRQDINA